MKKDLISLLDLDQEELRDILAEAARFKQLRQDGIPQDLLNGKTLAMIFEKPSTRTRISFEVGMVELGGHALYLNTQDLQIGRGEEIRDTARVTSRYVSGVMMRATHHETIVDFARHASIPVINGLSDREHPCQLLADMMTLNEHFGALDELRVAWVGDGDNVCNSFVRASALSGMEIRVAGPAGYEPAKDIVEDSIRKGGRVTLLRNPEDAVKDADVVVTDTWISMGSEDTREERLKAFQGYTVDSRLMKHASPDAVFIHCLPAHRGQEVTDEVIEGPQSLVWDEAENRLHAEKAVLVRLLGR